MTFRASFTLVILSLFSATSLVNCSSLNNFRPPQGGSPVNKTSTNTYRVLYNFGSAPSDGINPAGQLLNVKGVLYGTTQEGGGGGGTGARTGTVFSITTSGTERILHRFGPAFGYDDGWGPNGSLVAFKGSLYGTTANGGTGSCYGAGCGTVYSISKKYFGGYTQLHQFGGPPNDGSQSNVGLVALNDVLYGTTKEGGANNLGTVFSMTPSGTEAVLHSFAGGAGDGSNPGGPLTKFHGILYGTTEGGGTNGDGMVYGITPTGTLTAVYSFAGGTSDGQFPYGPLVVVNGVLYGTTYEGGANNQGTVFSITTTGTETVLHSFGGSGDGGYPTGVDALKGMLYGTTLIGGANGLGAVFGVTPSGTETVLHSFAGASDGSGPLVPLTKLNGVLYGTTGGGGTYGDGTVFSLIP